LAPILGALASACSVLDALNQSKADGVQRVNVCARLRFPARCWRSGQLTLRNWAYCRTVLIFFEVRLISDDHVVDNALDAVAQTALQNDLGRVEK